MTPPSSRCADGWSGSSRRRRSCAPTQCATPTSRTSSSGPIERRASMADLHNGTISDLGRALRARETTPTELTRMYLERLDSVGRRLNAVATLTEERAMREARQAEAELAAGYDRGPLHGIPYGAKDLLATPDYPTGWGAAPFKDQ